MINISRICLVAVCCILGVYTLNGQQPLSPPQVKPNKQFLVTSEGTASFFLGDNTGALFHKLDSTDTRRYLDNRASNRFMVIRAVFGGFDFMLLAHGRKIFGKDAGEIQK